LSTVFRGKFVDFLERAFLKQPELLDYLSRYTHRTAISNHRIRSVHNGQVSFTYRERDNGGTRYFAMLAFSVAISRVSTNI